MTLRRLPRPAGMTRQEHRRLYRDDLKRFNAATKTVKTIDPAGRDVPPGTHTVVIPESDAIETENKDD